jgi:chromosome segregation ATPase
VNMQNFMCHRNFTQNFYSGVNYITGENGSGKSAVIVAISAALGANFSKIGKGDDVSSCIGTADPISVITVVLRNDPLNPRHCNKYGNPVVVERTLVRRGEVGKISNKNTIKIDGKEVRKCDLMELMAIMSIDVGNPAVVLNQDDAKSFGDGNDSKDLYKYFLDATGLRQSLDECEKCKKQVLADKANISQCIEVQKKIEEGDYAVAKRDKEKCSNLNDLRNKIDELVADLSVLEVYDVVKKLDEKSEDLREYQETRVKLDAQIAQLALELDSMRAEESAVELQGKAELDAEMNSIVQQLQHLTKKAKEFTTEHGRKNTEKAQAEATIRRIEKQIHDEEKARDAAREEFERQDRNKGKRMAAKMKEEAEGCLQKVQQRQDELHSLEGETEECEHEIRRTQTQFDDIKSNISNLDERMRKNKSSRGKVITREEIIRRYAQPHSQSVDLVQARNAIDAAQKRGIFRGSTPVGPLGLHITLKPEGRRFCKPIFQSIGLKALGAFLFESVDDREAFKKSREFQAIPNGSSLTMYVLPSSVHNEPEFVPSFEAVPGSSTHVCMDLLNFDNLWVKNAVLQFAKLDQCHVVDQYDKTLGHRAQAALRSRPRLTVVVRAIDGHETRAVINSVQSTTNNVNVPSDIFDRSETIDAEASLREMESEKQHLTRDYQRMDKERRESTNALKQLKDREQRLQTEIATYQKKRKQLLADARELEIEAEALPQEFDESSFDEAIQSKRATLDARKEEVLRCLSELEIISKNQSQVQDQMKKEVKKRENVEQKLQSKPIRYCSDFARALFYSFCRNATSTR